MVNCIKCNAEISIPSDVKENQIIVCQCGEEAEVHIKKLIQSPETNEIAYFLYYYPR